MSNNRGVVANRQKRKGPANVTTAAPSSNRKSWPGKPKEDEHLEDGGSDEILEDHEEEEDNDDYDYEGEEEEEEEERQEAEVEESFDSSSADEDPDFGIDHEHDRLAGVGVNRKRGDCAGLRATDHTVVAPRQPSRLRPNRQACGWYYRCCFVSSGS